MPRLGSTRASVAMTGSCESFGPRSTDSTERPRNSSSVKPSCSCTAGIGVDDLAGARVGHQQAVLRLLDDGAIARLERQAVRVEAARTRHQQHGDDGEAADQQAEQDRLVERGARGLRVRAARNLELHQPDRRAHLVAQDQIAVDVIAARRRASSGSR